MAVDPVTGRITLEEDLHESGGFTSRPSGGGSSTSYSTPSYSYSGSDDGVTVVFLLVLLAVAIVCSYLGYAELKPIDGGGFETVMATWGALVMIPVLMFGGLMLIDTPFLAGLWAPLGILVNGYNLIWGEPVYFMTSVYGLISAVCATIVTWWVLVAADC